MTPLKVSHVQPTIDRAAGGTSVSVRRLIEELLKLRPELSERLFAGDAAAGMASLDDWREVTPRLFPAVGPRRVGWSPGLRAALVRDRPQLVHLHGLWRHHAWAADRSARDLRVPLLVSPHGMLEPWALRQGRSQKWLASVLFQRRMLSGCACIVATSRLEAEGIRAAGYRATPVAVIPNGVDLPPVHLMAHGRARPAGSPRTALFISRIHPKKGLLDLLTAWRALTPAGWRLRIVGPDDGGHTGVVARQIQVLGLGASVSLEGALWGEAKARAYAQSDLFVLPSYSENFGLVIAEALASGLPVITTTATPWGELDAERCGWWIDPGPAKVQTALQSAFALPPEELAAMGRRGRVLMERRYAWAAIARDMMELYRWLLGEIPAAPRALMFS